MTSSDDPDRDRRQNFQQTLTARRSKARVRATTTWSKAARHAYGLSEYSQAVSPTTLSSVARRAARTTLEYLQCHDSALQKFHCAQAFLLDLSFVGDDEMTELNSSYRGKNKPTDVLSFAQTEGEEFPAALGAGNAEEVLLGDVIISVPTAQRQALELHHSLEREIAFLTIHGTLHLCGFDHDTSSRRRIMWKLQDTIIESLFPTPNSSSCSSR